MGPTSGYARREQMLSALLLIPALERTFENRRSVPMTPDMLPLAYTRSISTTSCLVAMSHKCGLMHCSTQHLYSIISAARVSSPGGRIRPSSFAVFRLIRSSNLVA